MVGKPSQLPSLNHARRAIYPHCGLSVIGLRDVLVQVAMVHVWIMRVFVRHYLVFVPVPVGFLAIP